MADLPSLPTVNVVSAPLPTDLIPNPLNTYASYTYSWSFWWLGTLDYNLLKSKTNPKDALNWSPSLFNGSGVIAEDGNILTDQRHPATLGLNYHIQDVEFTTVIGMGKQQRSSNLIRGSMTIIEPYGVSLIETLTACSFNGLQFNNYTQQPFMLQLDFVGYDDNGDPIDPVSSKTTPLRKRFPVTLLSIGVDVTSKGTEYKITFAPFDHIAHHEYDKIPKAMAVSAGTVKQFFLNLANQLNDFWLAQVPNKTVAYADKIFFDIDPTIANSTIVPEGAPATTNNPTASGIDQKQDVFNLAEGTSILDIINKVMAVSSWQRDQVKKNPDQSTIFNAFSTDVEVRIGGVVASNTTNYSKNIDNPDIKNTTPDLTGVTSDIFDGIRNTFPKAITYKIHQFPVFDGGHPSLPLLSDSKPHTIKRYQYIYTGQNTEIIDLKINLNATFYTSVLNYRYLYPASGASKNTSTDAALAGTTTTQPNFSTAFLQRIFPSLSAIPLSTPMRVKPIVYDNAATSGMGIINDGESQRIADMIKHLQGMTKGQKEPAMLTVDLTINGDPTLIKQDDVLYSPSPTIPNDYSLWSQVSQSDFCKKYGFIRMDVGQLIVNLLINTPLDIDTDININFGGDQGLVYPNINTGVTSTFSGQYRVISIQNKFANGQFTQVLKLAKLIGADLVDLYQRSANGDRTDAVQDAVNNSTNAAASDIGQTNQSIVAAVVTPGRF